MPVKPKTYIHEFAHPRLVVHFHPDPADGGAFRAEQAERALGLGVQAIELDLRYRRADGAVACDHDAVGPGSPTLAGVVDLVLARKSGADTVNDDGRQFFLALDPREDSSALFDGLFATLGRYAGELSTAVGPGDPPRAITAVLTGAFGRQCHGYLYARHGEEVNRLLVAESVDYTGLIADLSRRQGPRTFQWTVVRHGDDTSRGRVNALHVGTDSRLHGRFNVRVWDTTSDDALRLALASGADSVNCNLSKIARFEDILRHQEPRGLFPHLTVRAGRALLTWQGAPGSGELYAALGRLNARGLSFSRQISLTLFLQDQPTAVSPAATLTPAGGVLIAYERGRGTQGGGGLWYLSGRFVSPDRFLTFDGREHPLTAPDSGRIGTFPSVAVAPDGRVVIVYSDAGRLWYFSGFLTAVGELIGTEYELSHGNARRGSTPSIAIDRSGQAVVLYEGTREQRLWYVSGTIDDAGRIVGQEHQLTRDGARRGRTPSVAFDEAGRIVAVYQGTDGERLWYVSGRLRDGVIDGNEFSLTEDDARRGSRPTVAFDGAGRVVVLYRGTNAAELRYVHGTLDASGRIVGRERLLDIGLDRR